MIAHNLPRQSTAFVGRNQELAEISRLLADPACQLLTLLGPGGIGKTRLALEVAAAQVENYPEGVCFVPLQPLTSPDFSIAAIAESLHFQFYSGGDPKQQLLDYLREKSLLLVLDNFEHLLDGAGLVSEILPYSPHVKVLVTSRERLNLVEEWVLEIQGLPVPTSDTENEITDYGAVQLFLQNARRVHVGFTMAETQKAALVRICQLVGGMPLGIELASAWVRALSCGEIAAEIERSLDILATSTRNVLPRHRSMRAVLEHSWTLLTDSERDGFKKLSIFRGGFRKEAAQVVAGASLQTLSALVDKSLLRVNVSGRYDIQEVLKQYGEEQLNATPEEREQTRDLHSAYYADFMHRQGEHLKTHRQRVAFNEIEAEIDNVRIAWRCMVEKRKAAEIRKFAFSLACFLGWQNWFQEALDLFGQAAEALRPASAETESGMAYGLVLANQAGFYIDISDAATAKALAEESLAIMRRLDSQEGMVVALNVLALATCMLQQKEWKPFAEEGLSIARETGDLWWVACFLESIGFWSLTKYMYAEATPVPDELLKITEIAAILEEGLAIAEQCGDPSLIAQYYWSLGNVALELEHYLEAKRYFEQGLKLNQETGSPWGMAMSYMYLARVATTLKDFAGARRYFRQELEIDLRVGTPRWQTDTIVQITRLLIVQGEKEWVVELLALVLQHPATMVGNRDKSESRLSQLQAELMPDKFAAAIERGRARDLETTVKELITDFGLPLEEASRQPAAQSLPDDLSERELEILRLIAEGLSNPEIAGQLMLSVNTVKWYVKEIFSKLQVHSRTQVIARARELSLLS